MTDTACYYRSSVSRGYPYNYYFWQKGKQCLGQENSESCTPTSVEVLDTEEELAAYEAGAVKPSLATLPTDAAALEAFLLQAEQRGMITWVESQDSSEVYEVLQGEVDSSESDVHIVFGSAHSSEEQVLFFNELLTAGEDGRSVSGITHVVGETFLNANVQGILDNYLVTGENPIYVHPATHPRSQAPMMPLPVAKAMENLEHIAYRECYNMVAANVDLGLSVTEPDLARSVRMREAYVVDAFNLRQDPGGKDVAFWFFGSMHSEKHRLPFRLATTDPSAHVVSVVLNGGKFDSSMMFDQALKNLGWLDRPFILNLEGHREADYVIHLPTGDRRILGQSLELSEIPQTPVLMPYLDPPG